MHWLPIHERLAKLEQVDGPFVPWEPDNSVRPAPYDRRLSVHGTDAAADLMAAFLAETTGQAFAMLDHIRAGGQRLRLAFDLMIAVAHGLVDGGIEHGFVSYRSHAEACLSGWPDAADRRVAWDRHYAKHSAALVQRVRAVVASLEGTGTAVPFVADWVEALRPYRQRGYALAEAGRLPMPGASARPADFAPGTTVGSAFHEAMENNTSFHRHVLGSPWFAAYRLVFNYTYLQLTRLGITPSDRFLLCHLVANAVEEAYACSALERIRRPYKPAPEPTWVRA
jgi:hypothetical protein